MNKFITPIREISIDSINDGILILNGDGKPNVARSGKIGEKRVLAIVDTNCVRIYDIFSAGDFLDKDLRDCVIDKKHGDTLKVSKDVFNALFSNFGIDIKIIGERTCHTKRVKNTDKGYTGENSKNCFDVSTNQGNRKLVIEIVDKEGFYCE